MWRTNIDVAQAAQWWPLLAAGISLLLVPFLFGLFVLVNTHSVSLENSEYWVGLGFFLFMTSVWAAPGMAIAIPFAWFMARIGYGGGAVALCAGGFMGAFTGFSLGIFRLDVIVYYVALGAGIGGLFWLIIRVGYPKAIGIAKN